MGAIKCAIKCAPLLCDVKYPPLWIVLCPLLPFRLIAAWNRYMNSQVGEKKQLGYYSTKVWRVEFPELADCGEGWFVEARRA